MTQEEKVFSQDQILEMLTTQKSALVEHINSLSHAADIRDLFEEVPDAHWPELFGLISDPETRANLLMELDEGQRESILVDLPPHELGKLAEKLESDDAADFIASLDHRVKFRVLKNLPDELRKELINLLKYPEDSAGGIMQVELASVQLEDTVGTAIERVRSMVDDDTEVLAVWVINEKEQLIGSIPLVDLLLNKASTPIKNIVDRDFESVTPLVDQEAVAQIFKKYDLITLPVVDEKDRLIGRIVIDDVMDVVSEEADEDTLHMGGTSPAELTHAQDVFSTVKLRSPWLLVALACSLVSASMMKIFEVTLHNALVTLYFIPVVTAMGGNVGTQAASVLIRGFATDKVKLSEIPAYIFREVRIGMLLGIIFGALSGIVAALLFANHNWYLGLVVFISMTIGLCAAATMGIVAPSLLKKFDFDPAISTGPFVTTMNDIAGIVIYMATATYFLSYLE